MCVCVFVCVWMHVCLFFFRFLVNFPFFHHLHHMTSSSSTNVSFVAPTYCKRYFPFIFHIIIMKIYSTVLNIHTNIVWVSVCVCFCEYVLACLHVPTPCDPYFTVLSWAESCVDWFFNQIVMKKGMYERVYVLRKVWNCEIAIHRHLKGYLGVIYFFITLSFYRYHNHH